MEASLALKQDASMKLPYWIPRVAILALAGIATDGCSTPEATHGQTVSGPVDSAVPGECRTAVLLWEK